MSGGTPGVTLSGIPYPLLFGAREQPSYHWADSLAGMGYDIQSGQVPGGVDVRSSTVDRRPQCIAQGQTRLPAAAHIVASRPCTEVGIVFTAVQVALA